MHPKALNSQHSGLLACLINANKLCIIDLHEKRYLIKGAKMAKKSFLMLGFVLMFANCPAMAGLQVIPIFTGQASVGSSYIDKDSSPGANLNFDMSPVLKFSDRTSLLPRIGINYNGVMTATYISDYGNLHQQILDSMANLKLVHELLRNSLKLRIEAGYKKEYARETRDEDWGSGLYDYDNVFFSGGIEKNIKSNTIGIGYRVSDFKFPNYTTLSSQEGKELMGVNTFDNNLNRIFLNSTFSIMRTRYRRCYLNFDADFDTVKYSDQKIANSDGGYNSDKRSDNVISAAPTIVYTTYDFERDNTVGLKIAYAGKSSNQNNYDVDNLKFISHFFDYAQTGIEPFFIVKFHPKEIRLKVGYAIDTKNYTDRLPQDENGDYTAEKTYTRKSTLNMGLVYPFSKKWELSFLFLTSNNSSNMKYEKYYKYNFNSASLFFGLSYEY